MTTAAAPGAESPEALEAFDLLIRVETALWNRVDRRVRREHSTNLQWFEVMNVVDRSPSSRVRDVADALLISEGGASKLVDRLEAAGHVDRAALPGDGRSQRIALTGSGRALLAGLRASVSAETRDIAAAAGPEATDALTALATVLRPFRDHLLGSPPQDAS